jgi:UDP-N-acetylmuramoyl-tripeptide--D-alanyl-D-alanine ligase
VQINTPVGNAELQLHIAGRHNVRNALAAAAAALASGVELRHVTQGLQDFVPVQGRSRWLQLTGSVQYPHRSLVDDTYNANPDSVLAAIAVLKELPGPHWLVLGDMGEVGEQGLAFHTEVLQSALQANLERIDVVGEWMRQAVTQMPSDDRLRWHESVEAMLAVVPQEVDAVSSILVKGSRFMRMERVVEAVMQATGSPIKGGGAHAH